MKTIGFIGCGNMGSALLSGIIEKGYHKNNIIVSEADEVKRKALQVAYGVTTVDDNDTLVAEADVILLAVKPQVMNDVLSALTTSCTGRLFISVAAGKTIASIAAHVGGEQAKVIRVMPNTPALIGAGMTVLSYAKSISDEEKAFAKDIFGAVGHVLEMDEAYMDIVTAISGSGPAYVFAFVEAFIAAGISHGLSEGDAKTLITQTFYGASRMLLETETSPTTLRKNVTSPGGTTEQGLAALGEGNVYDAIADAVRRAKERSEELSR